MTNAPKTLAAYIKSERKADRFPQIWIECVAGSFMFVDADFNVLPGKFYVSRDAAQDARSKALARW